MTHLKVAEATLPPSSFQQHDAFILSHFPCWHTCRTMVATKRQNSVAFCRLAFFLFCLKVRLNVRAVLKMLQKVGAFIMTLFSSIVKRCLQLFGAGSFPLSWLAAKLCPHVWIVVSVSKVSGAVNADIRYWSLPRVVASKNNRIHATNRNQASRPIV